MRCWSLSLYPVISRQQVCRKGKCSGSICLAKNMKECFLTSDRVHDKKRLCEIACQIGNDSSTCKSTSELKEIFGGSAVFMRPGAPCNNFQVGDVMHWSPGSIEAIPETRPLYIISPWNVSLRASVLWWVILVTRTRSLYITHLPGTCLWLLFSPVLYFACHSPPSCSSLRATVMSSKNAVLWMPRGRLHASKTCCSTKTPSTVWPSG